MKNSGGGPEKKVRELPLVDANLAVARYIRIVEVTRSNPVCSTPEPLQTLRLQGFFIHETPIRQVALVLGVDKTKREKPCHDGFSGLTTF